jgi:photosystem II stability/assembly factor-like uncharacterized protein
MMPMRSVTLLSESRMNSLRVLSLLVLPGVLGAQSVANTTTGTTQLLQAVSAVDSQVVWMTGHGGTVLRSIDGGNTWQPREVPGASALEFRDVHAVSADLAWVLSAGPGDRSRIYHTRDGGNTWALQFRNTDSTAFYDCFTFFTARRAVAFSDASQGRTNLLATRDGGTTWELMLPDAVPAPLEGEGAFAASGGCVTSYGERHGWVATGGPAARLFRTDNGGATWSVHETPMVRGPSAGMTAAHFRDAEHGIAVGGRIDAYATDTAAAAVAVTQDGGRTWVLRNRPGRAGALFAVTWLPEVSAEAALAAGPGGLFLTRDAGRTWTTLDERSFWTVTAAGRTAWAGGPRGTAVRVTF